MRGPLEGLKVLDLTRILAGPFCTMVLGDMGADVVKVENPDGGDDTRRWGPPFLEGESAYFLSVNRSKRSLTVNLRVPQGKALLRDLLARADVLIENFRPGAMERLGFGYEAAAAANPRLIYCSISGFGQTGPEASRPGYDLIVQGESGVMSLTGFPDGPPCKVGLSIADLIAGMYAVQGIALALYARERTGRGQRVDVALLDGMISFLTYQAGIFFTTGKSPARMGNLHPTIMPYETFEAADGHLNVAVGNNSLFQQFCRVLGRSDLAADRRFGTDAGRVEHRAALRPTLEEILRGRSVAAWLEAFGAAGIPCGAIKGVAEVFASPQVLAREMVRTLVHPKVGPVQVTGNPLKLSETPGAVEQPPPLLGEHTDQVLAEWLGLDGETCMALRRDGVI
ncbi:MAG: CoA transferase [candidate division NC10 bacterium]|nr:CoA transferase [candidate division NC10 bacterium]